MNDQAILKAKLEHEENYTVADSPLVVTMTATLDRDKLRRIAASKDGEVIPVSEIIDNFDDIENNLKKKLAFSYSLVEDPDRFLLNFLLLDCVISDIQSPDNNGGMVLGGSVALPNFYSASTPIDDITSCKKYKKLIDLNAPFHYVLGQPHAFSHSLKHSKVDAEHVLLSATSQLNPKILFPGNNICKNNSLQGSGGAIHFTQDGRLMSDVLLHGHVIDNDTMYPQNKYSTITEVLSAESSGKGGVKSQHVVAIPSTAAPRYWFSKYNVYDRDQGACVPLPEYAFQTYNFIDQYNASRCTNFRKCGICWNLECLKDVPQIKMKLTFNILPIVQKHDSGKEFIPYNNFVRHLSNSIIQVDKPFH